MTSVIQIFDSYLLADVRGFTLEKSLGYDPDRVNHREVFVVSKNAKKYILKIGRFGPGVGGNHSFVEELNITVVLSQANLTPKIKEIWTPVVFNEQTLHTMNVTCVVMDKWDVDMSAYVADAHVVSPRIYELLYDPTEGLVPRFHKEGFIHGNLHPANVVFQLDQDNMPIQAALIDFECTYKAEDPVLQQFYPVWFNYNFGHLFPTIQSYEIAYLMASYMYSKTGLSCLS